jgi:prophage DNA circulation protein
MPAEQRVAKSTRSDREGLVTSWMNHSSELAEKAASTWYGFVRDVQDEIHQRISGTLGWVESSQQGVLKVLRNLNDRIDKLSQDAIGAAENLTAEAIHTARDTGHELASSARKSKETS